MRILLTSNASYAPPRGGSTRSNLVWLDRLQANGHECLVVCPLPADVSGEPISIADRGGIRIVRIRDLVRRPAALAEQIREFEPDWVLVSSEDVSHVLLREAARAAPGRIIYLAHTPQFYPFGPASWHPSATATAIVKSAAAVVAIAHHTAGYIQEHARLEAAVVHPPMYGEPPYRQCGSFDNEWVLMINPSLVKGLPILEELARRMPDVKFAALKGWGTTRVDIERLNELPNVTLLDTVESIDEVLARSRMLLMPSLWQEGFGLIAMEAMLRGVPVIASNAGGLVEAKRGTGYVIPVAPIAGYRNTFDETHMPEPVIPEQDMEPWIEAVQTLTSDREEWEQEARVSRDAASGFVAGLDPDGLEKLLHRLPRAGSLRILLAHNSLYYPSHGGGDRSNRLLMQSLAARGHSVRVVARIETFNSDAHVRFVQQLNDRGVHPREIDAFAVKFDLDGVDVRTVTRDPKFRAYFARTIEEFDPDVVITSTDDPAQLLFSLALDASRARVVHLVRATIAAPFGPDSATPSAEKRDALARADVVAGVSEYVAEYVRSWGAIDAVHVPISLMESSEAPDLGRFDNRFVTMVNPCAVKGIGIFTALAARLPQIRFAAVPTWGTNAQDYVALAEHPNITILPPSDHVDDILRETRVLLAPSVWAEARSRIVVEAMARGVPVVASNIGGIPEAKLGVPYLIPVAPVVRYRHSVDENMVPVPEVPEQDIEPWAAAVGRLTTDQNHWLEIAQNSRAAALNYIANLSVEPFEHLLRDAVARPKRTAPRVRDAPKLSPDKQRLLGLLLKQKSAKKAASAWFPDMPDGVKLRLFCFPYAGGGTLMYSAWRDALPAGVGVCPVRLPGREARAEERLIDSMPGLVETLTRELIPYIAAPFAFFGHSMGAGIAFEVTRSLRRSGRPLPSALFVSGARAPRQRMNSTPLPEPSDEEFLRQLRDLDGIPRNVLDSPELLNMALPLLRADARLYRTHVYLAEPALHVPIFAYGGESDPNGGPESMNGWEEETAARFEQRTFRGGHFYLQADRASFLATLGEDLLTILPVETQS